MSGEKNRKMEDPVQTAIFMERSLLKQLDRKARLISKKNKIKASRADVIRAVLTNYVETSVG